jgi:hypothetical protein
MKLEYSLSLAFFLKIRILPKYGYLLLSGIYMTVRVGVSLFLLQSMRFKIIYLGYMLYAYTVNHISKFIFHFTQTSIISILDIKLILIHKIDILHFKRTKHPNLTFLRVDVCDDACA